ncbi:MAG: nickel-responsive transcriptional regulator NikR [Dethiosulfovibrio peptidovorans]|nr:MAG: nickel-responsive transcriptional regulator NikR [Dethiosulfovibrio peptidovorans]
MTDKTLIRFGVAVPEKLLRDFDRQVEEKGIPNRSEALRQLIRNSISERRWAQGEGVVYGSLTISYNHHAREVSSVLTDVQHNFGDVIICTNHVHADNDHCLEVIMVKGKAHRVKSLVDLLSGVKAVNNLSPVITSIL